MKTALLSIAMALCFLTTECRADFIVGSVGFHIDADPFIGLGLAAERDITDLRTTKARSGFFQSVDFASGTPWGDFTVPATADLDKSVTISNADFGTFHATVISDVLSYGSLVAPTEPTSRNINILGTWFPGANVKFFGYTDPVVAELSVTLVTTTTMLGSVVSGAMVFASHGAAVPEPGSMLLLGAVSIAVPLRRRLKRRTSQAASPAISG